MMKISKATAEDVLHVALNMRERDYEEFSALSKTDNKGALAEDLVARFGGQDHTLCGNLGGPTVIAAAVETRPNVLSLLFFATDEFPKVADATTRFIKQQFFPAMVAAGVHRIEAVSLAGYEQSERWLGVLGLKPETSPLRGYGKNGEAFVMYSWVKDVRSPRA